MAFGLGETQVQYILGVTMTTTGDKIEFAPALPIDVVRWGMIATVAFGGAAVVALDHQPTAGSATGRVNAFGGTISPGTLAQGAGAYAEPLQSDGTGLLQVDPGEALVVEVTTGATTTGEATLFIEYIPRAFQGSSTQGRIQNMTAFTS